MTIYRSLTDEQLAERHDPGEYNWNVEGLAEREGHWTPRVECIPSRDPYPWAAKVHHSSRYAVNVSERCDWMPRPEFARPPVNFVLSDVRDDTQWMQGDDRVGIMLGWLNGQEPVKDFTSAEIDHARKVLTRLAALAEVTA